MTCFVIVMVGWVVSVCLHEFGHACVAWRGGDVTVRAKGYLTLNPLRYAHPVYSLVWPLVFVLLGGIGLPGGAVYINQSLLRSRAWRAGTALAGPAVNLGLALLLGGAFAAGLLPRASDQPLTVAFALLLQLQLSAVLLNLLPLPPLDGFGALAPWLPARWQALARAWSGQTLFILFLVLWYAPAVNGAFWEAVGWLTRTLGVETHWAALGWRQFRFWTR